MSLTQSSMARARANVEAIKREYEDAVAWTHRDHCDIFIPSAEGICLFQGLDSMENADQVREAIELGLKSCLQRLEDEAP